MPTGCTAPSAGLGWLMPGDVRTFRLADLGDATAWVKS
jgi:hypothetical protein